MAVEEQVSPTRMNLLMRKAQIKLAQQGVDLLKSKRDALVQEFFSIVRKLLASRDELERVTHRAYHSLIIAKAVDGPEAVNSAAFAGKRDILITIQRRNVWGVKIPNIEKVNFERYITGRNVSPIGVSTRVQIAAQRFEQAMNLILDVASTEVLLRRIGNEIRKTTRRVNALEQILIPRLRAQMRYIRDTLEERAREDTFRLKRLKKAKLKKSTAK